jgi:L,D-transpeptidase YcbB
MTSLLLRFIATISIVLAALAPATPSLATAAVKSVPMQIKSASGGKFRKFYKARGFLPIWSRKGTVGPEADQLIALLRSADLDGLNPEDYQPQALKEAVDEARAGTPNAIGRAELKLSKALFAYARDLRDPRAIRTGKIVYADARLAPRRLNPADVLLPAAIAPSLSDHISQIGWMSPFYGQLRSALADFRKHWDTLPALPIAQGAALKLGAKGDRVGDLRKRLGFADGARFDKPLAWKVKLFQSEHGLRPTGIADDETIAALNRGSNSYEGKMRLNLERARILPPASVRHIVVNVADARLWMIGGDKAPASMRVIVGKADQAEQTPMLAGMVSYAILNPYWNVPTDLVRDRVAHRVLNGQSFTGLRYEALSDWSANAHIIPPEQIDWKAVAAGQRELRVRMLPGGENFMGKMKFMLPNELGIYLHDFPDKSLFNGADRHLSSGCVRLEEAPRLGAWLFGRALETKSTVPEQVVPLAQPVPVYMVYLTVVPTDSGIAFLNDAYGRDGPQQYAGR